MNIEFNDKLFRQALDTLGLDSQIDMAFEECGELVAVLAQWKRGRDVNIIEEVADVLLTSYQLRLIFGADEVDKVANEKLARLEFRLNTRGDS